MINPQAILATTAACAAFLAFDATALYGGYAYELQQKDFGQQAEATAGELLVEGKKIKMTGLGSDDGDVVFDAESQTLLVIDHKRRSYFQLDRETIDQIAEQLNSAMRQMEEQMAKVPPAQRQMMERMMKDRMPQAPQMPELSVERSGDSESVAGYEAEKVTFSSEGSVQRVVWVAPWSEIEGSETVSEAFTGMTQLFQDMVAALSQGPMAQMMGDQMQSNWLAKFDELEGFPVRTREYDEAGELLSEVLLASVEERAIAESAFKAPRGYKRQRVGQ